MESFADLSPILLPLAIYALAVPFPGPSMVAISRASAASGPKGGSAAGFGTTAGIAVYAVATLLGLSALLAALPWMLSAIQLAGGLYLTYLGVTLIRAYLRGREDVGARVVDTQPATNGQTANHEFLRGFFVSIGNPKVAAFFFSLFAPVAEKSENIKAQFTVLAGILVIDLIYHQTLALAVSLLSRSFAQSRSGRWLDLAAGGLMTVFGVGLLVEAISRS